MPVLPDPQALDGWQPLAAWFAAPEYQTATVLVASWEHVAKKVFALLSPKDQYVLETDKRSIAIEQVRTMMNATRSTTPFGSRLIVLPNAERLSLPAAQALLKFLEEPTAGNRLLLTTRFPRRLLPTIRSRVQVLRVEPAVASASPEGEKKVDVDPAKLLTSKNRRPLTEQELARIAGMVEHRVQAGEPTGSTYRALLRLRDYYKIRSLGGNEKLAADVLLASLLELEREKR